MPTLPINIAFYGDDFTGSTDAMEALALSGLRTVLFLEPPTQNQLAEFPDVQAVGVAGVSRALPTEEMDAELRPVFAGLYALNPKLIHYKMCSTFDSSPEIGSIGRAIEIGREVFGGNFTPLVVGAPVLGRYVAFGNLFARSGAESEVFRLDRHPTMKHHPVTPMTESDLRLHLAEQTHRSVGLIDVVTLERGQHDSRVKLGTLLQADTDIVLFDTLTDAHLSTIGALLWDQAEHSPPLFTVGSSGVEYALTAHWREAGVLPEPPTIPEPGEVEQIIAVSGSCSPVTRWQIEYAVKQGFVEIALNTDSLLEGATVLRELPSIMQAVAGALMQGKSVLLHTCKGPGDPRIAAATTHLEALGFSGIPGKREMGKRLGRVLGRTLRAILEAGEQVVSIPRIVVAGGDTSGYVAKELGIEALEMIAPVAPGSPLCRVTASTPFLNGKEILFKGGQVGKVSLFEDVRRGIR
jgi:3-oxoisoapionate kinase